MKRFLILIGLVIFCFGYPTSTFAQSASNCAQYSDLTECEDRSGRGCYWDQTSTSCLYDQSIVNQTEPTCDCVVVEDGFNLPFCELLRNCQINGQPADGYVGYCGGSSAPSCGGCLCLSENDPRVQPGAEGQSCITNEDCQDGFECAPVMKKCVPKTTLEFAKFDLCAFLKDDSEKYSQCNNCLNTNQGIWTALGCIRFNPGDFITDFLKIALGIAGGIALLLMVYGSFLISTSAGDPKKAEEGKEIITGTIAGLLFIIFSVFLLNLIGIRILNIPGF